MDRSCRICGFFIENPTKDNIGYCLYFDERGSDKKATGESMKIPDGDEKSTAVNCERYFRKVSEMSPGEFLSWRVGIETFRIQQRLVKAANYIAIAAAIIACAQLYISIR